MLASIYFYKNIVVRLVKFTFTVAFFVNHITQLFSLRLFWFSYRQESCFIEYFATFFPCAKRFCKDLQAEGKGNENSQKLHFYCSVFVEKLHFVYLYNYKICVIETNRKLKQKSFVLVGVNVPSFHTAVRKKSCNARGRYRKITAL